MKVDLTLISLFSIEKREQVVHGGGEVDAPPPFLKKNPQPPTLIPKSLPTLVGTLLHIVGMRTYSQSFPKNAHPRLCKNPSYVSMRCASQKASAPPDASVHMPPPPLSQTTLNKLKDLSLDSGSFLPRLRRYMRGTQVAWGMHVWTAFIGAQHSRYTCR